MKVLITSAVKLSEEQERLLRQNHEIYHTPDGDEPLCATVPANAIEAVVCNYFFQYHPYDIFP